QSRNADEDHVDEGGDVNVRAERLEVHEERDADEACDEAERRTDESITHYVEGFEVVARVDVLLFQPRFVLADDVQVEIFYAHPVQVIGDLLGAGKRGSEKVDAFHEHPPERWTSTVTRLYLIVVVIDLASSRRLERARVSHTIFGFGRQCRACQALSVFRDPGLARDASRFLCGVDRAAGGRRFSRCAR